MAGAVDDSTINIVVVIIIGYYYYDSLTTNNCSLFWINLKASEIAR